MQGKYSVGVTETGNIDETSMFDLCLTIEASEEESQRPQTFFLNSCGSIFKCVCVCRLIWGSGFI